MRAFNYICVLFVPVATALKYPGCYRKLQDGAPMGVDNYSTTPGFNTWYVDGTRFSGTWNERKVKCLDKCRDAKRGYKYYILHDRNACLCAKQSPTSTRSGPADSTCGDNAVWPIEAEGGMYVRTCVCM